ncbi:ATP-binding cassette domain-containing protein [Candidatus Nitrospira salsa]
MNGLDLTLGHQEIYGLLAANGSGKSTLAYIVMGCDGYAANKGRTDVLTWCVKRRS